MTMEGREMVQPASAAEWRSWLAAHHATHREVWLVFYKKGHGDNGLTYGDAVQEALCFGWIDSAVRRVDGASYAQRFGPRRARSNWSAANRALARRLLQEGRLDAAGLATLPADLAAEGTTAV